MFYKSEKLFYLKIIIVIFGLNNKYYINYKYFNNLVK